MSSSYKLIYFNSRGAGEAIRLVFNYANIEFEDIRIESSDWPSVKPTTPFGQLPLLEVNGKKINQSIAILRFVAKLAKLTGNDDWEDLEIDAIVDTVTDARLKLRAVAYEADPEKKKEIVENVKKEVFPFYFEKFDKIAEKNGGHLALGRLTWADFYLAGMFESIQKLCGDDVFDNYPNMRNVRENVIGLPGVKEWVAKRPKTEY